VASEPAQQDRRLGPVALAGRRDGTERTTPKDRRYWAWQSHRPRVDQLGGLLSATKGSHRYSFDADVADFKIALIRDQRGLNNET